MKIRFLVIVALLLSFHNLSAQSLGVHIGGNLSSATVKEDGGIFPITPESKLGFLAGVVANIPLATSVSFRPEINYIQKGYKISFSEDFGFGTIAVDGKETFNYIEVPLNVTYNLPAGANTVFLGGGPSVGYGLSGKSKSTITQPGQPTETENEDVNFGGDEVEDDYKPLDFGLNINGGLQLKEGFFVKLAYTFGMSNLFHDSESSFKNKGFAFSVGYLFPKAGKSSK